jgi:quercetin dioxygenase-like cupin family protein
MSDMLTRFDFVKEIADAQAHKPWPSGLRTKVLLKTLDLRFVLICMETGARLKEHQVDGTSSVHVLKGSIRYSALGQVHELQPGSLLTVGASIRHEVEGLEDSAFLLTISAGSPSAR